MTQIPPAPTLPTVRPTNTLGVVAFGLSLTGAMLGMAGICCLPLGGLALLCVAGTITGLIAMRKEPRGWAIAGVAVGIAGTIIAIVVFGLIALIVGSGVNMARETMETSDTIVRCETRIDRVFEDTGTMPSDAEGNVLIADELDAWGNRLLYERQADDEYEIISAGRDGVHHTDDDVDRETAAGMSSAWTPQSP